jgi:hypothetical protein
VEMHVCVVVVAVWGGMRLRRLGRHGEGRGEALTGCLEGSRKRMKGKHAISQLEHWLQGCAPERVEVWHLAQQQLYSAKEHNPAGDALREGELRGQRAAASRRRMQCIGELRGGCLRQWPRGPPFCQLQRRPQLSPLLTSWQSLPLQSSLAMPFRLCPAVTE